MRGIVTVLFVAGVIGLIVAQFLGPERHNPKVDPALTIQAQLQVPDDVTSVLQRACRDCHTNTTDWQWYGAIAPGSWLMTADVYVARSHMNFSEWGKYPPAEQYDMLGDICKMVSKGEMPLWYYKFLHWPSAFLSRDEVDRICAWTNRARAHLVRTRPN
jgi:hypothetical protein